MDLSVAAPAGGGRRDHPPRPGVRLLARLRELKPGSGGWAHTATPALDPAEVRAWLIEQIRLPLQQTSLDPGMQALYEHLLRTLAQEDLSLPPPPQAALRLFELLQDEEISIHSVCEELRQEPALVQQVWSKASSALFATPPRDLQYAVARIGLRELARIAAAEVISSRTFRINVMPTEAENVRLRSIATAEVSTRFAQPPFTAGHPYLSGLLHAAGALLLLRTAPIETPMVCERLPELIRWLEAPLGMVILHTWGMPREVVFSVGFSPTPEAAPPDCRALCTVTRAAIVAVRGAEQLDRGYDCGAVEALGELGDLRSPPEELLQDALVRLRRLRNS